MNPTQAVIRDGPELVGLIVACAPVEWTEAQMRLALNAIMARAIGRGLVWGTDWINCWPQSDGEWEGVLTEGMAMMGAGTPTMRPAAPAKAVVPPEQYYTDDLYATAWKRLEQYRGVDDCDQLVGSVRICTDGIRDNAAEVGPGVLSVALFAYDLGFQRANNPVV